MKKLSVLLLCIVCMGKTNCQNLTGLWYSSDKTRVYEIKQTSENKFEAIIKSSSRKTDSIGYVVIKDLHYNSSKERYEGTIYAMSDGQPEFVKIKFDKKEGDKIDLKIKRMFFMDIAINWIRV